MKCPRCGKDMFKSSSHVFCSHCGYLDDGKQIRGYTEEQASDLEIYLGNDYDSIVRNNNAKSCFFLGPLYFLVRGFLFLGIILQALEIYIWVLLAKFGENIFLLFLGILVTRTIAMIAYNPLCLFLYQLKIKYIKKKYPSSYLTQLRKENRNSVSGPGIILLLFVIIGIIICFYILYSAI